MSAVYFAAAGKSRLVAVTEQLLSDTGHLPFQYVGSIGPAALSSTQHQKLPLIGDVLTGEFKLRGLFGVDLVIDGDDVWTIEINPRWTASVEVLERTLGFNAIAWHIAACRDAKLPETPAPTVANLCGKLIVYAQRNALVTNETFDGLLDLNRGRGWPIVADIPPSGTQLRRGQPVVTVFAEGHESVHIRGCLQLLETEVRNKLGC